jgi:hypothetical protein
MLPLGPRLYLGLGVVQYVLPMLATVLVLLSVLLCHRDVPVIPDIGDGRVELLLGIVAAALFAPKGAAVAAGFCQGWREGWQTLGDAVGAILLGLLVTPAMIVFQTVFFLYGAFGSSWPLLRSTRVVDRSWQHLTGVAAAMLPVSALGLHLWSLVDDHMGWDLGAIGIRYFLLALMASPLTAILVSCPWRQPGAQPAPAVADLPELAIASSA